MTKKRYMYWRPGEEKPKTMPKGVEYLDYFRNWQPDSSACVESGWITDARRWPVTEAEYRTHCYCEAYGIAIPEGWRVVDFRSPAIGEAWLTCGGDVDDECTYSPRPILERIEEWIIPTDEDAKQRPRVQVWDDNGKKWIEATLYGVCDDQFITNPMNYGMVWSQCRIKKENPQ
jgi:hypothetical protein